ncbi:MAG: endonuclease/exonuclease/phosphatase family protein [Spirochaetales bacterium]|nr:endonuclease/exonuclease/phosphatase family protein [Spirochaetales bacterium]
MFRVYTVLAILLGTISYPRASAAQEQTLVVGTFNVHYIADGQGDFAWQVRRDAVARAIRDGAPDIVAFQEMETFEGGHYNDRNVQLEYLRDQFPAYAFGAVGDPAQYPSTQPIMYRRDRFDLLEQGFFFFSATPDVIYSPSWDGRFPAFASWVRLYDRQRGERFYIYNVHFDHGSRRNRLMAAELTVERIAERTHREDAVLVVGDFNAPRSFRPVRIVAGAGLHVARSRGSTIHFNRGVNIVPAIDHVLYSERFRFRSATVIRKRYDAVWPSDHYPVFVTFD